MVTRFLIDIENHTHTHTYAQAHAHAHAHRHTHTHTSYKLEVRQSWGTKGKRNREGETIKWHRVLERDSLILK